MSLIKLKPRYHSRFLILILGLVFAIAFLAAKPNPVSALERTNDPYIIISKGTSGGFLTDDYYINLWMPSGTTTPVNLRATHLCHGFNVGSNTPISEVIKKENVTNWGSDNAGATNKAGDDYSNVLNRISTRTLPVSINDRLNGLSYHAEHTISQGTEIYLGSNMIMNTEAKIYEEIRHGVTTTSFTQGCRSSASVNPGSLGSPIESQTFRVYDSSGQLVEKSFDKYHIIVKTRGNLSTYYSQFRLGITGYTSSSLPSGAGDPGLEIIDTAYVFRNWEKGFLALSRGAGTTKDQSFIMNISNKMTPQGGWRTDATSAASSQNETWTFSIDVSVDVSDPAKRCESAWRNVGIYDSDWHISGTDYNHGKKPQLKIEVANRNQVDANREFVKPDQLVMQNHRGDTVIVKSSANPDLNILRFDGVVDADNYGTLGSPVYANAWELYRIKFDPNKVYRLTFSNMQDVGYFKLMIPFEGHNANLTNFCRPYIKSYFGGISAGGQFNTNSKQLDCKTGAISFPGEDGDVITIADLQLADHSTYRGSSSEYELSAYGKVLYGADFGLYTDSQQTGRSDWFPQALTFANTKSADSNRFYDIYGQFGRKRCISNYIRALPGQESATTDDHVVLTVRAHHNRARYYPAKPAYRLTAPSSFSNLKTTLFFEGDLRIESDIINNTQSRFFNPFDIGFISIIVMGDIFINPDVQRIDAVLVAYPKPQSKGEIHTCHRKGVTDNLSDEHLKHYEFCQKQLTINGAAIAKRIALGRIAYNVEDVDRLETANIEIGAGNNKSSEEFNLLPEYFLSRPVFLFDKDFGYKVDYVTELPINL